MAINTKYSYKNFRGADLTGEDPADFSHSTIVGSTFFQPNSPKTIVFPSGVIGITFERCNLDNVVLPEASILIQSSNLLIRDTDDGARVLDDDLEIIDTLEHFLSVSFWRDI